MGNTISTIKGRSVQTKQYCTDLRKKYVMVSSYLRKNTMHLHYKDKPAIVQRNICFCYQQHTKHDNAPCEENPVSLKVTAGGTYGYH
jgi:hypothetical protein